MEREDTNGNAEADANGDTEDTETASERGTPEGFDSLEDSVASLEMEQSETGRRTSIFKFYSYKSTGERPPRMTGFGLAARDYAEKSTRGISVSLYPKRSFESVIIFDPEMAIRDNSEEHVSPRVSML